MLAFFDAGRKIFADRFRRPHEFEGSAEEICDAILEKLWSGTFYRIGQGHFDNFWSRDLGTVSSALMRLGHRDRLVQTITWGLAHYMQAGRITTTVSRHGRAFNAPNEAIDTLAWLLHAIDTAGMDLTFEQKTFLEGRIHAHNAKFLDPALGTILPGVAFCELRDAAKYRQSAYAVTMLAVLKEKAKKLNLDAPVLAKQDYAQLLLTDYWNGRYFNADLDNPSFSAECNLFPVWMGVLDGEEYLSSMLEVITEKNLTKVHPMQYTDEPKNFTYRWWEKHIMANYAGSTIWTWHGVIYLHLLSRAKSPKFADEHAKFEKLIQRHRTFPELLNEDGSLYKTWFYKSDHGMIWAALYLDLIRR